MDRFKAAGTASALLLAAAVLTGCNGGAAAPSAKGAASTTVTMPTTSRATTASPTPTEMSLAKARAIYLQLVVSPNKAGATVNSVALDHQSTTTLRQWTTAAKALAAAEWTFAQKLRSTPWPASVKPEMVKLSSAIIDEQDQMTAMAEAATKTDFTDAWNAQNHTESSKAANQVRAVLGLPAHT